VISPSPPVDIVRAVREELATPGRYHFGHVQSAVQGSWLQLLWNRFTNFAASVLRTLFAHLHVGSREASMFGDVLVVLSLLIVAGVLAAALIALRGWQPNVTRYRFEPQRRRSSENILRDATQAAAGGEFARAVRLLFRASVVLLAERGLVTDRQSATVNELRRNVRAEGAASRPAFDTVAAVFTAAAYAQRDVDARAWEEARAAYDDLQRNLTS
jgi:hypothetical protein